MLSKVDANYVSRTFEYLYKTVNFTTADTKDAETQHFNYDGQGGQLKPVFKYTPEETRGSNVNMTFTYNIGGNSGTGTGYLLNTDPSIYNVEQTFIGDYLNVSKGGEVYFHAASNDRTYGYLNAVITTAKTVDFFAKQTKIYKNIYTRKSKPRELKAIGGKARSTLYGYHTDGTRYTG